MTNHELMQSIYDKHFASLNVSVPAFAEDPDKVAIYVDRRLTCNKIYGAWSFPKWKSMEYGIDAELDMVREARSGIGSYLVRVLKGIEPDKKFLGKSTCTVDPDGTLGITLRERMLLELIRFEATGKHLDVRSVTLCSGSRFLGGYVPSVCLRNHGGVGMRWYGIDNSHDRRGVRSVVLETL